MAKGAISQRTNVREKAMEESASNAYSTYSKGAATNGDVWRTTGLLKRDLEQFERRYRQTCCTILKWLLGMACASFGTLTVLLAIGFGWLG